MTELFILRGVAGSTAHGLAREGSDEDLLGIYALPTRKLVGLDTPKLSIVGHEPQDFTYHEVSKYMSLALKANPTALELLWLDTYMDKSILGNVLIEKRNLFLSEKAVHNAFKGYAMDQMRKAQGGNQTAQRAKNARHMFRLMDLGYQLKTTGDMQIRVSDPQRYWDLEQMSLEQWLSDFEKEVTKFDEAKSVLPEEPNREILEKILVSYRRSNW